jgi:hypothetical protein
MLLHRTLIAFVVGAFLAWAVPVAIALLAAAPGLATLTGSIKAAGLPLQPVYFALTNFLPALLVSFGAGRAMFRVLGGKRVELFVACSAPWLLWALYLYLEICVGTSVSCMGPFELAGLAVVPLGLLLAALVSKPPSLNRSTDTAPQRRAAASPQSVVFRSSSH